MSNPIYIQYYSHEGCSCYKIDLPWSKYKKDTVVLCRVSDGEQKAIKLAKKILASHLSEALTMPINQKSL